MDWSVIGPALLLIVVVVLLSRWSAKGAAVKHFDYQKLPAVFTPAERSFFGVLDIAVGDEMRVLGKVRVADVITPAKGQIRSSWQGAFNKISSKHFDFVLCDKSDLSPICAVELNDRSHKSKKANARDLLLTNACKSAGLPLLTVPAKRDYIPVDIRKMVFDSVPGRTDVAAPVEPTLDAIGSFHSNADQVCPKCGSSLVVRKAKRGKNIGKTFTACSAFPACRYSEG